MRLHSSRNSPMDRLHPTQEILYSQSIQLLRIMLLPEIGNNEGSGLTIEDYLEGLVPHLHRMIHQ
jgi:hypothetical protein